MTEQTGAYPSEPVEVGDEPRFIRSLRLTNFLSFGGKGQEIELQGLNVLVGANGSGKSNFVEALGLLSASVTDLSEPIRQGGGIGAWFYNGDRGKRIEIRVVASAPEPSDVLEHTLGLAEVNQKLSVESESIYKEMYGDGFGPEGFVYELRDGEPYIGAPTGMQSRLGLTPLGSQSIFSQLKGRPLFSDFGALQNLYGRIHLYRDWTFGPRSVLRGPQASDLPSESLSGDFSNLFLMLNKLDFEPEARAEFLERLREFLPEVGNYTLQIQGPTVQLFLRQGRYHVPATRLSDGTLRWLCLLAILVAPSPPGVVVMEEPELGLHPDMINTLAEMLRKAATRHQIVITTHSDILIDALSDVPESVMVVEKGEAGTTVRRLDAESLKPWLEEYRLGRLWMKGQIGGTRW